MSVQRFRLSIAVLAVVGLCLIGVSVLPSLLADPDGWEGFNPIQIDAEPLITQPADVLTSRDRETIRRIVAVENQDIGEFSRRYGIPWSVAVVRDSQLEGGMNPDEYAATLLDDFEIESEPGADDGLLMMAVIPEGNHPATTIHFATGQAFYPRGGITPERLDWIADVQMAPLIADNTIGDAIIEGAIWVEWMQFFEPPPNPAPTVLQAGLRDLLHPFGSVAFAGLALLIGGGGISIATATRRGTGQGRPMNLDLAGAIALSLGRVNRHVVAAIVLDAIDRETLINTPDGLAPGTDGTSQRASRYDARMRLALTSLQEGGVVVTAERLVRYLGMSDVPGAIEDDLARHGLMHPRSPLFHLTLRIGSSAGVVLGIAGLILAVLGEVESTLLMALALTIVSITILVWNESRSWTTRTGEDHLSDWLLRHDDDRDRRLFETVRRFDDVDNQMQPATTVRPYGTPAG